MSALQKKYFGRGHGTRKKSRVISTARRKRSYRGFAKRSYSRVRGLGGGKFGGMIPPVIGGAADTMLSNISLPIIGKIPNGVGSAMIGHFMGSQTTRDIGLYQIGASLPGYIGLGGGSATGTGHIGQV